MLVKNRKYWVKGRVRSVGNSLTWVSARDGNKDGIDSITHPCKGVCVIILMFGQSVICSNRVGPCSFILSSKDIFFGSSSSIWSYQVFGYMLQVCHFNIVQDCGLQFKGGSNLQDGASTIFLSDSDTHFCNIQGLWCSLLSRVRPKLSQQQRWCPKWLCRFLQSLQETTKNASTSHMNLWLNLLPPVSMHR